MANKFEQAYILLTKYAQLYAGRYGSAPVVNKYREKWGMQDVVDTIGSPRALELLEYYFRLERPGHPLVWFYNNFDKMDEAEARQRKDNEHRRKLRAETKAKVEQLISEGRSR